MSVRWGGRTFPRPRRSWSPGSSRPRRSDCSYSSVSRTRWPSSWPMTRGCRGPDRPGSIAPAGRSVHCRHESPAGAPAPGGPSGHPHARRSSTACRDSTGSPTKHFSPSVPATPRRRPGSRTQARPSPHLSSRLRRRSLLGRTSPTMSFCGGAAWTRSDGHPRRPRCALTSFRGGGAEEPDLSLRYAASPRDVSYSCRRSVPRAGAPPNRIFSTSRIALPPRKTMTLPVDSLTVTAVAVVTAVIPAAA